MRRVLVVVDEGDDDAGDEAGRRQQNRHHGEDLEGQPDEEPALVRVAVRPLEHPGDRRASSLRQVRLTPPAKDGNELVFRIRFYCSRVCGCNPNMF